jgi:Tol biopolymer transport system component
MRISVEPGGEYNWALSPDGSEVAILKTEWTRGLIHFFPVNGSGNRTVSVKGYTNLRSLVWAPDAKNLFVGTSGPGGATLLRIDLDGNAQPLWQQPRSENTWGHLSPDGRHLSIYGLRSEANAWVIDNF